MTKVYEQNGANLMFCNSEEFNLLWRNLALENTSALFCAKYPYHKEMVGYSKSCPKDDPEYLVALRGDDHYMALNMVDAPKPEFFSDEMVDAGLNFIGYELASGRDVVVVCNQGESRSPTMCLMYMMQHGCYDKSMTHTEVFDAFKGVAPSWNPNNGILQYCIKKWDKLREA